MCSKLDEAPHSGLLEAYLEDASLQGLTDRTIRNYRSCVRIYLEQLDGTHPRDAEVDDLKRFLAYLKDDRDLAPASISRYFSALNSFYQYLAFEDHVESNPVPAFRKRYLASVQRELNKNTGPKRQLLSVEEMRQLVHNIMDIRDRAVLVILAKTGIRRNELVDLDITDLDLEEQSIQLKSTPKRSNRTVFFDDETSRVLQRWLAIRQARGGDSDGPLFLNQRGGRLNRNGIYQAVTRPAEKLGFHDPDGDICDKFTPHCCRHWFTTHLRRSGMKREYISWLRGDAMKETMDIYLHLDPEDVHQAYRTHIPQLSL